MISSKLIYKKRDIKFTQHTNIDIIISKVSECKRLELKIRFDFNNCTELCTEIFMKGLHHLFRYACGIDSDTFYVYFDGEEELREILEKVNKYTLDFNFYSVNNNFGPTVDHYFK